MIFVLTSDLSLHIKLIKFYDTDQSSSINFVYTLQSDKYLDIPTLSKMESFCNQTVSFFA
jgi:hypothetical protein